MWAEARSRSVLYPHEGLASALPPSSRATSAPSSSLARWPLVASSPASPPPPLRHLVPEDFRSVLTQISEHLWQLGRLQPPDGHRSALLPHLQGADPISSQLSRSTCARALISTQLGWKSAGEVEAAYAIMGDAGDGAWSHTCIGIGADLIDCHNAALCAFWPPYDRLRFGKASTLRRLSLGSFPLSSRSPTSEP